MSMHFRITHLLGPMVALALLALLAPIQHASAESAEPRTTVVVLPPAAQDTTMSKVAAAAHSHARALLKNAADFRVLDLSPEALAGLRADPLCRYDWACLEPLLPSDTRLVLDLTIVKSPPFVALKATLKMRGLTLTEVQTSMNPNVSQAHVEAAVSDVFLEAFPSAARIEH